LIIIIGGDYCYIAYFLNIFTKKCIKINFVFGTFNILYIIFEFDNTVETVLLKKIKSFLVVCIVGLCVFVL